MLHYTKQQNKLTTG